MTLALRRGALRVDPETYGFVMADNLDLVRLRQILEPDDQFHVDAALRLGRWAAQMSLVQICSSILIRPMFGEPSSRSKPEGAVGRHV